MKTIDDGSIEERYSESHNQSLDVSDSFSLEKIATPTFSKKVQLISTVTCT